MKKSTIKKIIAGLGLGASGALGYTAGSKIEKKRSKDTVEKATQSALLSNKLKERSESANRRLKIENYYIRKALNQLASRQSTK